MGFLGQRRLPLFPCAQQHCGLSPRVRAAPHKPWPEKAFFSCPNDSKGASSCCLNALKNHLISKEDPASKWPAGAIGANENIPIPHHRVQRTPEEQSIGLSFLTSVPYQCMSRTNSGTPPNGWNPAAPRVICVLVLPPKDGKVNQRSSGAGGHRLLTIPRQVDHAPSQRRIRTRTLPAGLLHVACTYRREHENEIVMPTTS